MNKYIAFLRAVNVGGHNKIKMDDLKKIFVSLGYKNVKTLIQSGNVIFESSARDSKIITQKIEKKLQSSIGNDVKAFIRTEKEIEDIFNNIPFKNRKLDEDARIYIAFLYKQPDSRVKNLVKTLNNDHDTYFTGKKEIYCLIHKDKKRGSYFSILQLEKKLNHPLTTRSQTTILKIKNMLNNE